MKSTKKAFTLVELIVVITILAILGTIAFISLGSYTGDARNAKRTDGISKIATSIENALIDGKTAVSFAANDASRLTSISVAGTTPSLGDEYEAGDANYSALNIKAADFVDPNTDAPYVVGATSANNYEVAASLEDDAGDTARVMGNWSPRGTDAADTVAVENVTTTTVELSNAGDINKIRKGDSVTIAGATGSPFEVLKVSRDGETITLNADPTGATSLVLAAPESAGLIGAEGALGTAVIDGVSGAGTQPY